jgi:hypothetical protein
MFQELTNVRIHLQFTVCAVCDDIVLLAAVMLRGCQAGGLHDG